MLNTDYKLKRSRGLSSDQEQFLRVLIPWAKTTRHYVIVKAVQERERPIETVGVFPSVLIAFCLYRSLWGKHAVAVERYVEPELKLKDGKPAWKHGNNIALVVADEQWQARRPTIDIKGAKYKSYRSIADCGIDLSDIIAIKPGWKNVLTQTTIEAQIEAISQRALKSQQYKDALTELVRKLELYEFD